MDDEGGNKLEFAVMVSLKVLASFRSIDPQAPLPAYGAGAFNGEPDHIWWVRRRGQVDVATTDVGGTTVSQWQQVNLVRGGYSVRSHVSSFEGANDAGTWILHRRYNRAGSAESGVKG